LAIRMSHILLSASSQAINSTNMIFLWVITPCFFAYANLSNETVASTIVYRQVKLSSKRTGHI